jgi:glyoxylase-like metal-dependent hydrolase (beta-lactamase superfamily II)
MSVPLVEALLVGAYDNNVYLLTCPSTGERVLIDPADEPERILQLLAGGKKITSILLTHGDADHFQALEEVREATGAPVGIHPADRHLLSGHRIDFEVHDGDQIRFGEVTLEVFHTPGHTAGGICFYSAPALIAGDTLFPGGPGNTRREGGDFSLIMDGIQQKLFTLPAETVVYPGHGKTTTIGAERPHLAEWLERGW